MNSTLTVIVGGMWLTISAVGFLYSYRLFRLASSDVEYLRKAQVVGLQRLLSLRRRLSHGIRTAKLAIMIVIGVIYLAYPPGHIARQQIVWALLLVAALITLDSWLEDRYRKAAERMVVQRRQRANDDLRTRVEHIEEMVEQAAEEDTSARGRADAAGTPGSVQGAAADASAMSPRELPDSGDEEE